MQLRITSTALILPLIACSTACTKLLDVPAARQPAERAIVFKDSIGAEAAARGVYSRIINNDLWITNGGVTIYGGLSADELLNFYPDPVYDLFAANELKEEENNGIDNHLWYAAFRHIYDVNAVIEGVEGSIHLPASQRDRLVGEMLIVRSLEYFYLVNLFGNVPWITGTDYQTNSRLTNTDANLIYQYLISDLLKAKQLLSAQPFDPDRSRPDRYVASALLARIWLFRDNWMAAEQEATEVIDAGKFRLCADPVRIFLATSEEAIWQMPPKEERNATAEGYALLPSGKNGPPPFVITHDLLNAFEQGDLRKGAWTGFRRYAGQDWFYCNKYRSRSSEEVTEGYMVLRLAELILIRAEARAWQLKSTEALEDLNKIRNRAGLPLLNDMPFAQLNEHIFQERRIELMAEWGHRWLDLKRTARTTIVLGRLSAKKWKDTDALYPVPLQQRRLNPALLQNPGY